MKKFTLVFVLFVLTLSFAALFYFVISSYDIFNVRTSPEIATEASPSPSQESPDMGPSVYKDYDKDLYDRALDEKRVIVLFFTANWCSVCEQQEVINVEVFSKLDKQGAVGLRVHILDSETTDQTNALAKKFDVSDQHTFVVLDSNGVVFYKGSELKEENFLHQKILDAMQNNDGTEENSTDSANLKSEVIGL